jgi:WS/DGAT/MGAT family acyltransferase
LPARIIENVKAVGEFVGGSLDFAPPSSLNQAIGPHRRFETILADLEDIKAIKNHFHGTVNDVVVTIVTGGLRHLMKARGERIENMQLRAMIPVSVRQDAQKGSLGNRVASVWATLPVYEPDPVRRLEIVHAEMQTLKSSGQAVGAQVLTQIGEWAPPTIVGQASRVVARQRAFNLVITNVPGPQIPLYTLGRQMLEVYPVLPLAGNTTIGVALISYHGTIGFGLLGDYDTAPDLGVFAEGIEKSLAELLASIG